MATDLERLVVSLDADVSRLSKQLAKAGVDIGTFARDADRQTKVVAKKISDNLGGAGDSKGLNTNQFQILGHVARASFESIAAGASPLRVIAQEGVKASAAIGEGGLSGLLGDLRTSMAAAVSPTVAVGAGVLALGAAGLYAASSFEAAQSAIKLGLTGVGAASKATVNDIEEIGEELAHTQRISVAAGREIALAMAKTGQIGVGSIGGVGALVPGFAKLTGTDLAEASRQLGGIFSDPTRGAQTLNSVIGTLDDRTLEYIRTLDRQGDRQKAIEVLVTAAQPQLQRAASETSAWARAWEAVSAAASRATTAVGGAVSRVANGPSLEEQAAGLKAQIEGATGALPESLAGMPGFQNFRATIDTSSLEAAKQAYDEIIAKIEERNRLEKQTQDAAAAAQRTVEAGAIVRTYDEAGVAIRDLQADYEKLGKAIADANNHPDQQIAGGTEAALASYDALGQRLAQLKADYQDGGTAAAAALREANFSAQIAGASSFARGLAEINHRYDELILKARAEGQARGIPALEASRQQALAAYGTESGERAKSQATLPDDFARIVIGAEGNNASRNPRSSASGIGQFIDSTFIDLYRKEFTDLAATMDDAAILKMKSDFAVNSKLIEAYGRENAVKLQSAGFKATAQNLYLAHNYGAGGAINLLKAAPDASATGILGADASAANPAVAGHTAGEVIAEAARRSQRFSSAGRQQQEAIVAEKAQAEAYGLSAAATARLDAVQQQLNADRERGGALGQQFATAQALIQASSASLTPELARQREEILALADARAKAAETTLSSRFLADMQESYAALGRTAAEQDVYNQAKTYADPGSSKFAGVTAELTKLHDLTDRKADTGDFVKGLVGDLIQGKDAAAALTDEMTRLLEKLADRAIDSMLASLFSTGSSGGLGGLGKIFGFAEGGRVSGPGTATSDSIPALLSDGEYVLPADVVRRYGPMITAMHQGRVGRYASGGPVGHLMPMPMPIASRGTGDTKVEVHNYGGAQVRTRQTTGPDQKRIIQVLVDDAMAANAASNSRGTRAVLGRESSRLR